MGVEEKGNRNAWFCIGKETTVKLGADRHMCINLVDNWERRAEEVLKWIYPFGCEDQHIVTATFL